MKTTTASPDKRNTRVYVLNLPKVGTSVGSTREVQLRAEKVAPVKTPLPQPLHPTKFPQAGPGKSTIKVGLDLDAQRITATIQWDHLNPPPARHFQSTMDLLAWVTEMISAGHVVYTVYEACGFGYCLHYTLRQAGAISLVIAPVVLDRSRRRKNDRIDSAQLCLQLSRYVDGNLKELHVIRIPSVSEQQRRELGRQRAFWRGLILKVANHGRALRLEHEGLTLSGSWWGPVSWKRLEPKLTEFVRGHLERMRQLILQIRTQFEQLTEKVEMSVAGQELPKGLGALTMALVDGEVCDWGRFAHRKAAGSYTGGCPSEKSSGGVQRTGHIDRHGNGHVRTLLVEAVWRLVRYHPTWHAFRKLLSRLSSTGKITKRWAVALARQLAVDLWRVRTDRCTWAELGFLELTTV
jgi:transposase